MLVSGNNEAFLRAVDAIKKKEQSHELSDVLRRVPFDIANYEHPWVQVAVIRAVGHHFDEINPDWLTHHLNKESAVVQVAALRVIGDKGPSAANTSTHDPKLSSYYSIHELTIRMASPRG